MVKILCINRNEKMKKSAFNDFQKEDGFNIRLTNWSKNLSLTLEYYIIADDNILEGI